MKDKKKRKLSEKDIDNVVMAQAEDDSAWEKPIRVRRRRIESVRRHRQWQAKLDQKRFFDEVFEHKKHNHV